MINDQSADVIDLGSNQNFDNEGNVIDNIEV